jgi:Zn-dependent peptidase ImmA (M78 family)
MAWSDRRPFVEARAQRHDAGLTPTEAADPFALAELFGIEVVRAPMGEDSPVEGAFLRRDNRQFVLVNAAKRSRRQRFTCAHELGHAILLPPETDTELLDTGDDLEIRPGSSLEEREANLFAAELLLPEAGARQIAAAAPSVEDALGAVVRTFDVSPKMAAIRLREIDHIDQPQLRELLAVVDGDWQRLWREQRVPPDPVPSPTLVLPTMFRRRADALAEAGVISAERYEELVNRPLDQAE